MKLGASILAAAVVLFVAAAMLSAMWDQIRSGQGATTTISAAVVGAVTVIGSATILIVLYGWGVE